MKPTKIEALAAARIGRDAFQRIEKNAGTTAAVRAALARMLADQHQERAAWGVPPAPVPGDTMPAKNTYEEQRLRSELADAQATIATQRAELDEVDRKLERTIGAMRKTTEAACMRNRELETAVLTLQAERDNARTALERVSEQLARAMAKILGGP